VNTGCLSRRTDCRVEASARSNQTEERDEGVNYFLLKREGTRRGYMKRSTEGR